MFFRDVNEALPILSAAVGNRMEVGSRLGDRTREMLFANIELTDPLNREVLVSGRKASLPAQIAESVWVLAGRNDIEWLEHYLPRAGDFSDDGTTWRAGYGPRIRKFPNRKTHGQSPEDFRVDQLAHVVNLLNAEPDTRRAVISLYDPAVDTAPGKDIACNNWLHLIQRDGLLHLHVATRSNDLWWGWSGINQFEWSVLLEVVAGLTGFKVGSVVYDITSLHLYQRHYDKAAKVSRDGAGTVRPPKATPRFESGPWATVKGLDELLGRWFIAEEELRAGVTWRDGEEIINRFPEPMLRSWLRVIAWWWSQNDSYLEPLKGTALASAAWMSPLSEDKVKERRDATIVREGHRPLTTGGALYGEPVHDPFTNFIVKLHEEKGKVYGDSWKRRGEQVAIQANVARKVDRLGVAGAGDTAADTAIDLFVYLAKYRLWLTDHLGVDAPLPVCGIEFEEIELNDSFHATELMLRCTDSTVRGLGPRAHTETVENIRHDFEELLKAKEPDAKLQRVHDMLRATAPLARHLWEKEAEEEMSDALSHAERNATRSWKGYDA